MGNPPNLAIFGAPTETPQETNAPAGAGLASGTGKGVIAFDQFLKGIRAGHAQLSMQRYAQSENQLKVAKDFYDGVSAQLNQAMKDPTPNPERVAQLKESQNHALQNYQEASDNLLNFFSQKGGGKGKGGATGGAAGQPQQNFGEKIGEWLKKFVTGPSMNTTPNIGSSAPVQPPATDNIAV